MKTRMLLVLVLFAGVLTAFAGRPTSLPVGTEAVWERYILDNVNHASFWLVRFVSEDPRKAEDFTGQYNLPMQSEVFVTNGEVQTALRGVLESGPLARVFRKVEKGFINLSEGDKFYWDVSLDCAYTQDGVSDSKGMYGTGPTQVFFRQKDWSFKKGADGKWVAPDEAFQFEADWSWASAAVPASGFKWVDFLVQWNTGETFKLETRNGAYADELAMGDYYWGVQLVYLSRVMATWPEKDPYFVSGQVIIWYDEGRTDGDCFDMVTGQLILPVKPLSLSLTRVGSGLRLLLTGGKPGQRYTLETGSECTAATNIAATVAVSYDGTYDFGAVDKNLPAMFFRVREALPSEPIRLMKGP